MECLTNFNPNLTFVMLVSINRDHQTGYKSRGRKIRNVSIYKCAQTQQIWDTRYRYRMVNLQNKFGNNYNINLIIRGSTLKLTVIKYTIYNFRHLNFKYTWIMIW